MHDVLAEPGQPQRLEALTDASVGAQPPPLVVPPGADHQSDTGRPAGLRTIWWTAVRADRADAAQAGASSSALSRTNSCRAGRALTCAAMPRRSSSSSGSADEVSTPRRARPAGSGWSAAPWAPGAGPAGGRSSARRPWSTPAPAWRAARSCPSAEGRPRPTDSWPPAVRSAPRNAASSSSRLRKSGISAPPGCRRPPRRHVLEREPRADLGQRGRSAHRSRRAIRSCPSGRLAHRRLRRPSRHKSTGCATRVSPKGSERAPACTRRRPGIAAT